jgi:hypothetical protein
LHVFYDVPTREFADIPNDNPPRISLDRGAFFDAPLHRKPEIDK